MTKKVINYKALRAELDDVLARLGDDTLDVDEMTQLYERGMELVGQLERYLQTAENKVQKIKAQWDAPVGD